MVPIRHHTLVSSLAVSRPVSILAITMLLAGCGTRAVVHGVLVPPIDGAPAEAGDGKSLDRAIVYAVPEGGLAYPEQTSYREFSHRPQGFSPEVLVVPPNTEVEFVNQDTIYHNLFSLTPGKRFEVGSLAPGERRKVGFDSLGVVQIFCELHPETSGFVVVAPRDLCLRPDSSGDFTFSDLSAGRYRVTVWHPAYGERRCTVTVPKKGQVELQLAY